MSMVSPASPLAAGYEQLGGEYYDVERHAACAAFRAASKSLVAPLLAEDLGEIDLDCVLVDVGAGNSLLAELLSERGADLEQLLITDSAAAMLGHSEYWQDQGANLMSAAANDLPVADGGASLVTAILGDPYNQEDFWVEMARVLVGGGQVLFTHPSYRWSEVERAGATGATFRLTDGQYLTVPSYVRSETEQRAMIEAAGLRVLSLTQQRRREMTSVSAPALDCLADDDAVVSCWQCERPVWQPTVRA